MINVCRIHNGEPSAAGSDEGDTHKLSSNP